MSCNIYEEPQWTTMRYSKGVEEARGEREDRLVDIYEITDTYRHHDRDLSTRDGGAVVQRNPFKAAALILGLLCLLLLVGISVLVQLYISIILKWNQPSNTLHHNDMSNTSDQENIVQMCLQQKKIQTQKSTGWVGIRSVCYYKSSEKKDWTESRRDCQSRGADLLIINNKDEHDFVSSLGQSGDFWIGLQSVRTSSWPEEWEWKWVDDSTPTYTAWLVHVNTIPTDAVKVYIGPYGKWNYSNTGSKQWICEKPNDSYMVTSQSESVQCSFLHIISPSFPLILFVLL